MLEVGPTLFEVITRWPPTLLACAPPTAVADMPTDTMAAWISARAAAASAALAVRAMLAPKPTPSMLSLKLDGLAVQALPAVARFPLPVMLPVLVVPESMRKLVLLPEVTISPLPPVQDAVNWACESAPVVNCWLRALANWTPVRSVPTVGAPTSSSGPAPVPLPLSAETVWPAPALLLVMTSWLLPFSETVAPALVPVPAMAALIAFWTAVSMEAAVASVPSCVAGERPVAPATRAVLATPRAGCPTATQELDPTVLVDRTRLLPLSEAMTPMVGPTAALLSKAVLSARFIWVTICAPV